MIGTDKRLPISTESLDFVHGAANILDWRCVIALKHGNVEAGQAFGSALCK